MEKLLEAQENALFTLYALWIIHEERMRYDYENDEK